MVYLQRVESLFFSTQGTIATLFTHQAELSALNLAYCKFIALEVVLSGPASMLAVMLDVPHPWFMVAELPKKKERIT